MKKDSGFSMVELIVVVSVIMVLALVVSSAVNKAKAMAHKTHCMNNLRQISLALNMYANDYFGKFPPDAAPPTTWASKIYPRYLKDERNIDCPAHAYVGRIATGADYWYVAGLTLYTPPQTLIAGCYEECHYGFENKLSVGGSVIFERGSTPFP